MLGTFALVLAAGGGDAAASLSGGAVTDTARAVAPALVVAAMIYAISDASGAHFNPAVSLAFALRREFPPGWLLPYWSAQLAGALLAAAVLGAEFGSATAAAVSGPRLVDARAAVGIEAVLTFLLVSVILGTADRARVVGTEAALAVGATIAACGLVAGPIEGASMNPARSLGPALVTGRLADAWIYLAGPILGACLAVGIARLLRGHRPATDPRTVEAVRGRPEAV
jgi:aquaporin Z